MPLTWLALESSCITLVSNTMLKSVKNHRREQTGDPRLCEPARQSQRPQAMEEGLE